MHEYPGGVPSRKEAKEDHYCVRTCFFPPNWSQVRNPEPLVPRSLGRQGVKFPAPLTRYFFTFIFYPPPPTSPHTQASYALSFLFPLFHRAARFYYEIQPPITRFIIKFTESCSQSFALCLAFDREKRTKNDFVEY